MELVFDFGNARGKWHNPRSSEHGDFRHAVVKLEDYEWEEVVGRGKPPHGFVKVNGIPYVIGDAARRYTIPERPRGAGRYRETYYTPALAYAATEAFASVGKMPRVIELMASHAPGDAKYARNIVAAAKGQFEVEYKKGTFTLNVSEVSTFDEPLGGYSHFVLTEKGAERKKNPIANSTVLVIDVGGWTTDVVAIDPGGVIDLMSAKSTRTGVINLTEQFEAELRAKHATMFQETGDIDPRRIEDAILTGQYKFGKVKIDCKREADAAINVLVNDVNQVIGAAGGAANYDVMLLTGGGAALIYDALCQALPRVEFLLAEPERDLMKYANVFGGAKISALLRALGEK